MKNLFSEISYQIEVPKVEQDNRKSFRELFCLDEVVEEEYPAICYGADPLSVIPGKYVEGKGLNSKLTQCVVTIRKGSDYFAYQNGEWFQDEKVQILDEECMLIFLGNVKEAFVLLPNEEGSGQTLFRFDDSVEIALFLETDLYRGKNGYYLCLVKDAKFGLNMCSITADPKSAEFMFRVFSMYM